MEDALQSAHGGASASVPPGPGPRFPATPLAAPRAPRSHPPSTSVPAPRAAAWLQPCRPPPAECTPRGPPLPAPRVRPRAPSHGDRKFRAARPDRLRHGREGGLTGRGRRRRPAAPRPAPPPSPRAPHLHCRAPSSCSDSALQPRLRLPPRSLGPRCPSPAQTRRGRFCRQLPPHRPRLARWARPIGCWAQSPAPKPFRCSGLDQGTRLLARAKGLPWASTGHCPCQSRRKCLFNRLRGPPRGGGLSSCGCPESGVLGASSPGPEFCDFASAEG